ncbi:hypothetical protein VTO42DRAFT_7961 [Malbranchea cinnamomea]
MTRKRKRGPVVLYGEENQATSTKRTNNGFSVAGTLASIRGKQQEVAQDGAPATGDVQVEKSDVAEEEWQTVMPSKKKRKRTATGEKIKYPELTFAGGRLQSSVKISDLQALLLYCFSDGVAPTWISVRNSGHVRKAVVLMVPGLEKGMFDGSVAVEEKQGKAGGGGSSNDADAAEGEDKSKLSGYERWLRGLSPVPTASFNPVPLVKESLPEPLQPLAEVFPHVWPVKSPGDSKYNKVYSPLQAILQSALTKGKESKDSKGSGPRPPRGASTWNSQRTPITSFLLTVQDMKENDFVRHPAVFDVAEDKAANDELRKMAGQTAEHGWVDTHVSSWDEGTVPDKEIEQGSMTAGREVLALDCEMCVTEGGQSDLTRISLVSWDGTVVLDELVKPQKPVIDYLTQYSGITKEKLEPITTTLSDIQKKLLSILHPRTILVGHSLNADLNALKMTHPFIVDTSVCYPHPRGFPLKSSLKWLAQKYLNREIQRGGMGHDSIEDARTALDLVKQKCEKGERWGTGDTSSESIFARLARTKKTIRVKNSSEAETTTQDVGRTGALVDWGTPERGFGAHATVALGCKNDDDVVAAVARVVNGDAEPEGSVIPPGGVDFTWARLRELEIARGWCSRIPNPTNGNAPAPAAVALSPESGTLTEQEPGPGVFERAVTKTVNCIKRIYESLPPCTLFMVYSGTGDPREVTRLQNMHKKYLEEFRSRVPWDQLSVKWTDVEEQALKRACQKAREGCAFLTVR